MAAYSYSQSGSSSSLPQGFSIHQAALGAPLQFFPAVGTQQLDDLLHAYLPGSASIQEKRATVSVDFLEHAQLTGQNFKFYPVFALASAPESPAMSSPFQGGSSISSLNVSPMTPSWDFSQVSSQSSASSRSHKQPSKHVASRHQTTDFSHIPGMKIMTKDGMDVTNSASRGSKTKEQRDHAHLMRVIKACESCRKKKVRCDPSHKRRSAAQAPAQPATKTAKKGKAAAAAVEVPAPVAVKEQTPNPASLFNDDLMGDLDSSFLFSDLEALEPLPVSMNPWDEFIQYPPMGADDYDYDFFFDPEGHLSPQSSSSASVSNSSTGSVPSTKSATSARWQVSTAMPVPGDELRSRYRNSPLHDEPGMLGAYEPLGGYADFNLYSPESSFSEDDRMVNLGSSSSSSAIPGRVDHGQRKLFAESSSSQDRAIVRDPAGVLVRSEWSHPGILATDENAIDVRDYSVYSDPASGRADLVRRLQEQQLSTSANVGLHGQTTIGSLDAWGYTLAGHCSPFMENVPLSQTEHDSVLATLVTGNVSSAIATNRRQTTTRRTTTEDRVLPLSATSVEATHGSSDILDAMRQRVSSPAQSRRSPDVLDTMTQSATSVETPLRSSDVLDSMSQRESRHNTTSTSGGNIVQAPEQSLSLHNVFDKSRQQGGILSNMNSCQLVTATALLFFAVGLAMWLWGSMSMQSIVSTMVLSSVGAVRSQFSGWETENAEEDGQVSSCSDASPRERGIAAGKFCAAKVGLSRRMSQLAKSHAGPLNGIAGRIH